MDEQRRLELRAGGVPETYREIMFQALSPEVHPQRAKVTDDDDLKRLDLTPNELVEMLARALAQQADPKEDIDPEEDLDIDKELKGPAVARILQRKDKSSLANIIRDELGPRKQDRIEDEAREMLRDRTTSDDPFTPDEAAAALTKITWKKRNDLAGSFNRTITECAEALTALVRAYLDRTHGPQEQARPAMPENEARLRGPATSEMFYRAVEPSTEDADIASVVGPALTALPALDDELREPRILSKQLASTDYLRGGQDKQLEAETSARRHFPFGLQRPRSLAIIAAAVYLIRAQCSDTIVRAAQPRHAGALKPADLFMPVRNALNDAVHKKSATDALNGWQVPYSTTPGALDCLRAAAPLLSPELSLGQVPAFLRLPPPSRPLVNAEDPAHRLLHAALPLDEEPKQSGAPWATTHWNPFGQRLLHNVNKEHYKQRNHPLFREEDFESVAAAHTTEVLTELIKRLQRAEGLSAGLPNTRENHTHSSVLSLNSFLSTVSAKPFKTAFKDYRTSLDKRSIDIRKGAAKKTAPAPAETTNFPELPQAIVLLTLDSVRATMERLLASVDKNQWAYTDTLSDPAELTAESDRGAAVEMLEVANWAEVNEALLRDMSLDEILTEYHLHHEALGNPPPEPDDAVLLRKLIFDTVITDATVIRILESLGTTYPEPGELSKDTDHDR